MLFASSREIKQEGSSINESSQLVEYIDANQSSTNTPNLLKVMVNWPETSYGVTTEAGIKFGCFLKQLGQLVSLLLLGGIAS